MLNIGHFEIVLIKGIDDQGFQTFCLATLGELLKWFHTTLPEEMRGYRSRAMAATAVRNVSCEVPPTGIAVTIAAITTAMKAAGTS